MTATDLLQRIADTLGSTATVRSVFGEAIQANGKTIVPVAKVSYAFGGGSGSGKDGAHPERQGEGGGGGGALLALPAGALEITDTSTRFVPFMDLRWIVVAFGVGAALGSVIARRRRS
jgi:uncharacterized spore protein YtfJ